MTTTDLWVTNLSGGQSFHLRGGLFGSASSLAYALMDFIAAGRATAHPDHAEIIDLEATVSGDLLVELLLETQRKCDEAINRRRLS